MANQLYCTHIFSTLEFLNHLWGGHEGYAFVGTKCKKTGHWRDHPIDLCKDLRELKRVLRAFSRDSYDLYFTPNTFSKPLRRKEFSLPTDLGWCDIDLADPDEFRPLPSILIRTSPGRYQGIWKWNKTLSVSKAEAYSHALTYRFGGDPGGWSITKYLRLPHTFNHKKEYKRPIVLLLDMDLSPINKRPKLVEGVNLNSATRTETKRLVLPGGQSLQSIIAKYRSKLHLKTKFLLRSTTVAESDRSKQIYMIVADLYNAGESMKEIADCLWVNPYFVSKHGQNIIKLNAEISRIIGKLR
jgi:hypothetical protein